MTAAHEHRKALVWLAIGGVSAVMFAVPIVFGIDMDSGGGALLLVGVVGVVSSVLVAVMYQNRARALREMTSKENLLAEWDLPPDQGGPTTISLSGIITDDVLYTFKGTVCSLIDVKLYLTPPTPPRLELVLDVMASGGSRRKTVTIGIPSRKVSEAQQAADQLRARYRI